MEKQTNRKRVTMPEQQCSAHNDMSKVLGVVQTSIATLIGQQSAQMDLLTRIDQSQQKLTDKVDEQFSEAYGRLGALETMAAHYKGKLEAETEQKKTIFSGGNLFFVGLQALMAVAIVYLAVR